MIHAIEVRFDKPVMPEALADLEALLGDVAFSDEKAALFSSRVSTIRGEDFAAVCKRVRAVLEVRLCDDEATVELADASAYRARGGLWVRIRPS